MTCMSELTLRIGRVEDGHVRVEVMDKDKMTGEDWVIWVCEVNQSWTKDSQKAALKATFAYLNTFIDLSEGGTHN